MTKHDEDWSDELKKQTRMVLEGRGSFMPNGDQVHLKHIDSVFGTIAVTDWLNGTLTVVDRKTKATVTYSSVDELIGAGWAVD